jgi:uncharacterized protein (TIGR03083 family)
MSNEWNFMDPASRTVLLTTVRGEAEAFYAEAERADWEAPTACAAWQVRDVVGHMIDVTEGYFAGFDHARAGADAPDAAGLRVMADRLDDHARSFRSHPRDDVLKRGRHAFDRMMGIAEGLTDEEWSSLLVTHPYMGPVPAGFYPEFQLIDYTVHTWDMREGAGRQASLSGDAADLLVPVTHIVWQSTADTSAVTEPFAVGIRIAGGHNGGDYRFDVTPDGVSWAPGPVDDLPAVLEFDPASYVLTVMGRIRGGTLRGDAAVADRFRGLFFAI